MRSLALLFLAGVAIAQAPSYRDLGSRDLILLPERVRSNGRDKL